MPKTLGFLALLLIILASSLSVRMGDSKADAGAIIPHYAGNQATTPPAIIPYIIPAYYGCIDVLPVDLENSFNRAYRNKLEAEALYNGKVYLFKDLLVDKFMIRELDKGWIWADLIKCPIINLAYARNLKPGDRVDIVGVCMGRDLNIAPSLYFRDCYILLTGSVQLPAPGGGAAFTSTTY